MNMRKQRQLCDVCNDAPARFVATMVNLDGEVVDRKPVCEQCALQPIPFDVGPMGDHPEPPAP